jgi:hypothetical protein
MFWPDRKNLPWDEFINQFNIENPDLNYSAVYNEDDWILWAWNLMGESPDLSLTDPTVYNDWRSWVDSNCD